MAMKYAAELWHVLEIGKAPPPSEPRWLTHLFQWAKEFLQKRVSATLRELRDALLTTEVLPNVAPSRQCGAIRTLVSFGGLRVVSKVHCDRVKIADEEKRCPTCQRVLPLFDFSERALAVQKRDPRKPYFENYHGVRGPLVWGCVQ